ncbi:ALX homeobox protein 1-like [Planoprotostelium fungivorum]|uniref:ALX homeobox protein 1-like n=1 Tax=Planoprotostelium fungivorum TaxID=1890364 RepID=A0A2P6NK10_9EUKA|nr:ALX homeobox protein 1-like [Planoprotostelium fungivorum]
MNLSLLISPHHREVTLTNRKRVFYYNPHEDDAKKRRMDMEGDRLSHRTSEPLIHRNVRRNFSTTEKEELSCIFLASPYPSIEERVQLAKKFYTTERRVQVWFQNQRARTRKSVEEDVSSVYKVGEVKGEQCHTSTFDVSVLLETLSTNAYPHLRGEHFDQSQQFGKLSRIHAVPVKIVEGNEALFVMQLTSPVQGVTQRTIPTAEKLDHLFQRASDQIQSWLPER